MNYKGVIFDFNGTLFFDSEKHKKAWQHISEDIRGYTISEEEFNTKFFGLPNKKVVPILFGEKVDGEIIEHYSKLKESYYRELCKEDVNNFHLVKGSYQYFEYLKKKGIPFTIASASIKENIDFFITSFQLEEWMDIDTIVYDDGTYEDKVKMFLDASSKIGIAIEDTLIIEDSISGIKDAYTAGCRKIVVMNGNKENLKLSGVIQVISDFDDLIE